MGYPILSIAMLFFLLVGGFLLLTYPNSKPATMLLNIEPSSPGNIFAEFLKGPIFWAILLTSLFLLFFYLRDKNVCKKPTTPPYFEGFEENTSDPIESRISLCKQTIDRLQLNMDNFFSLSDDTCNILNDVEDMYLGTYKAPADKDELNLPKSQQEIRRNKRIRTGKAMFEQGYQTFNSLSNYKNLPVYSCKSCSKDAPNCTPGAEPILANKPHPSMKEARTILKVDNLSPMQATRDEKVKELYELAQTLDTFTINIYIRLWQLSISLGYCESLVKKAIDNAEKDRKLYEGFENEMTQESLLAYVDKLLEREQSINMLYTSLSNKSKTVRNALNSVTNKGSQLEKGDVTESDIKQITK